MVICAVYGCNSNNDKRLKRNINESIRKAVKFFRFPKDDKFIKIWIEKTGRKDKFKVETSYICSKHFTADDYARYLRHELLNYSPSNSRKLKFDAVPSLNILGSKSKTTSDIKRYERQQKRKYKQIVQDLLKTTAKEDDEIVADSRHEINEEIQSNIKSKTTTDIIRYERQQKRKSKQIVQDLLQTAAKADDEIVADSRDEINEEIQSNIENKDTNVLNEFLIINRSPQNKDLIDKNKKLTRKYHMLKTENECINKLFTPGQRKILQTGGKRIKWTVEEISKAKAIYSISPKAYEFLLKLGYPFPAVPTLKCWASKNNLNSTQKKGK